MGIYFSFTHCSPHHAIGQDPKVVTDLAAKHMVTVLGKTCVFSGCQHISVKLAAVLHASDEEKQSQLVVWMQHVVDRLRTNPRLTPGDLSCTMN